MSFLSPRVAALRLVSPTASSSSGSLSSTDDGDSRSLASSSDYTSSSCYSTLPSSLETRSCISEAIDSPIACSRTSTNRSGKNEHLAVLLPKYLWKPDSLASRCETFGCLQKFSIIHRKHHCRKCGGIFCSACTTRSTPLLDTSNLHFLHPPRNIPISVFESPLSPITQSRVCDHCWQQIHAERVRPVSLSTPSSPVTTNELSFPSIVRPPMRRSTTSSTVSCRPASVATDTMVQGTRAKLPNEKCSWGELDAYPLKQSSMICKANGGGRWTPRQIPVHPGYRIPGGKSLYEIELEQEDAEARLYRLNPVIRDGEFQLRVPRQIEPCSPTGPFQLSTF